MRVVAVDAPETRAADFSGSCAPNDFEVCIVQAAAAGGGWSVLELFDEGRGGTNSSGSLLYKQEAAPSWPADTCPRILCELDGALFGPGLFELTPAGQSRIAGAAAAARAAKAAAASPKKRARQPSLCLSRPNLPHGSLPGLASVWPQASAQARGQYCDLG